MDERHMREAIRLARDSVMNGSGGPFGAVVVRQGEIVGRGANRVTVLNDPTAHAEVQAIRDACQRLQTFDLTGCEIYVNCMPCPMCMGAIYWARLARVYYAATTEDAAAAGFDDLFIATEMGTPKADRSIPALQLLREEALPVFYLWLEKPDKVRY